MRNRGWIQRFEDIGFAWVRRNANKVAYKLAKAPIPNDLSFVCHMYVPRFIENPLHEDYVNSS